MAANSTIVPYLRVRNRNLVLKTEHLQQEWMGRMSGGKSTSSYW